VKKSLGPSRIFSFGVGQSPNRYLLDHMAKLGNGAVAYLPLTEKSDDVMAMFFDRISHPAMTDVTVDYGDMQASQTLPTRVPDLFVGRPIILTGRFVGHGRTTVTVTGTVAGQRQTIRIPVDLDAADTTHAGIASVWARQKIADLCDLAAIDPQYDWRSPVRQTALQYGLMSPFTAFLAVDTTTKTAGDHGTTVAVPVPVPEGVKYETTVKE
jgi:Ca-activated chloride channel family protein